MLVEAGKFITQKPEMAAEIAVNFLDPKKQLGLKVPILKNVLTETKGIKSGDLQTALFVDGEAERAGDPLHALGPEPIFGRFEQAPENLRIILRLQTAEVPGLVPVALQV